MQGRNGSGAGVLQLVGLAILALVLIFLALFVLNLLGLTPLRGVPPWVNFPPEWL